MSKTLFIGADPEIFLQDAAAGGLVASIGLIGGSKEHPRPLPIGDGYAVQEDNVALEYNIPPAASAAQLVDHINKAMAHLSQEVGAMGLKFSYESAAFFPADQLIHPNALEFGCDPDYNAWTGEMNPRPSAADKTLRSCGGHVHVGRKVKDVLKSVKLCDLFLGVPSTVLDKGQLRKQLYGKKGAFRPKPYGFEYRVLSNYWVFRDNLIQLVYNNTRLALDSEHIDVDEEEQAIEDAINGNNLDAAKYLIAKYSIPMGV